MSYKKILENLEAVPENEKLLAANVYHYHNSDGRRECGCALGKGLPNLFKRRDPFARVSNNFAGTVLNELNIESFLRVLVPEEVLEGMTPKEAHTLQKINDKYQYDQCEQGNSLINRHARYLFIVNWLSKQVRAEDWTRVDA